MSSTIQPADDSLVGRLLIAAQMGADPTREELLSLIARIEADRERMAELERERDQQVARRFSATAALNAAEAREKALRDAPEKIARGASRRPRGDLTMSNTPTIQPATDEQIAEMKADTSYGHSCDLDELLSLIARMEADRERKAELERERDTLLWASRNAPDLNGLSISNARSLIKEKLGLSATFFDDLVAVVVLRAEAAEAREKVLAGALRCLLGCADHQNPEVWEAAVAEAEAALSQTQARGGEQSSEPATDLHVMLASWWLDAGSPGDAGFAAMVRAGLITPIAYDLTDAGRESVTESFRRRARGGE